MQDLVSFYRDIDPETRTLAVQTLRIIAILVLAWILQAAAARLIRIFRGYMARRTQGDEIARVDTLARVFRNVAGVVILLVAGMLVLGELGISVAPILATAGVAGIAIGFGAQSLVKNFLAGFFILFDDQIRQGDVVQIAGIGGLVELVTLRYVRLRDLEGHVHFVPNGEITVVTNRKRYNDPQARLSWFDKHRGVEILRLNTTRLGREPRGQCALPACPAPWCER